MINKKLKDFKIVRPVPEDAENMVKCMNIIGGETDFLSYGKNDFYLTVEEERKFLKEMSTKKTKLPFFIAKDKKGEVVASGTCFPRKRKRFKHVADLGITVRKKHWGKGIGGTIMDLLIKDCIKLGIKKIELKVRVGNKVAIQLYKKKGFEIEGLLIKDVKIGRKYYDSVTMARFL